MKTKFDNVLSSFIKEAITIDQDRLSKDLERLSKSLPDQTKKALETTSQALAGATETDPIESEFIKLSKYKDLSDDEKIKIVMGLIDKKVLPDITQKHQKDSEESEQTEKPKQSSFTYSAPSIQ